MINDEDLKEAYWKTIKFQEEHEIIEDTPKESNILRTYYMPQHVMVRPDRETTKYTVTFDCSSKEDGMASLNDLLETEKYLFMDLLMNLVRFRCYQVRLSADIEKAFLKVG